MNLLEEFCNQIGLRIPLDLEDIKYTTDSSDFNCIDGEEGDNGIIKYYALDGDLIAIRTVFGGDSEDVNFTHWGKDMLQEKALNVFYKNLDNVDIITDTK
jgi:hypothetical protein